MAGYSKNELVTWMREKPRTLGWGAILAFNRTDTNTVLLQEYIDRFSTQHYLPPVQGYIDETDARPHYISGYTLDYPRLSFEIANVEEDIPDARLSMRVVGGTHVVYDKSSAGLKTMSIDIVDPLNGPALTLRLHLTDVPGTVNSAGQIVLDLSRSSDFSLSYSEYLTEQKLGGLYFKELFEALPDEKRIMVLSEIIQEPDNPIKPAQLKIRTQAAPDAKRRSAENYGDGAVLVFVAMEGEPAGGNPDASYRYLIPNDAQENYGATVLLSNKLLIESIVGPRLKELAGVESREWVLTSDAAGFFSLSPVSGRLEWYDKQFDYQGDTAILNMPPMWLRPVGEDDNSMAFRVSNERIGINYVRSADYGNTVVTMWDTYGHARYAFNWNVFRGCRYVLDKERQQIESQFYEPLQTAYSYRLDSTLSPDPTAKAAWESYWPDFQKLATDYFNEVTSGLTENTPPINTFVLHSLLFRNNNAVVLDDVALPGDMAIFGRVGPSLTRFSLDPLQPLIGLAESLQFTTQPAGQTGLSWKVENIPGSTGDPGTVSSIGLYNAPTSIEGAFTRVKVTASAAGFSSSALVSVVVNDITVGPQIQICDAGFGCKLSAGTRGTGALNWSLHTPDNGGKLEPADDGQYLYTAAKELPDKKFIVDEIVVTNELTGKSKTALVMVIFSSSLIIKQDLTASLPPGQAKLRAYNESGEIGSRFDTAWDILAGSGTVADGLFTSPATLEQRFALVRVTASIPDFPEAGTFSGYSLLPLPLIDDPTGGTPGLSFMTV